MKTIPAKRIETNRQNLIKFFGGLDKHGVTRAKVLKVLTPKTLLTLAQAYLAHTDEIDNLFAYVRRFKQAVGELTEEDIRAASDELAVRDVMES